MSFSRFERFTVAWRGIPWAVLAVVIAIVMPAESEPVRTPPATSVLNQKFGVGSWIWAAETHDQQLCRLWRGFEIPAGSKVVSARLRIAADNSYSLFLDGREIGRGDEWENLTEYDLTMILEPGQHALAVEAFNTFKQAGVLVGLAINLADGRTIEIASDQSWKVVPLTKRRWETKLHPDPDWPAATIIARFMGKPWGVPKSIFKAPPTQPITYRFWQTGWFQIGLLSLCAVVTMVCVWLVGKLALHSRIQRVVQRERSRIARDIHDDVTAGLTQLVLLGEVLQSTLPAGSEPRQEAKRSCEKARNLVSSMNDVIWAIDSRHDTMRDFSSHVCRYAESFLQSTPIRCRFDLDEEMSDRPFDLGRRRNLFLAVKEALHNAVKHSGASELSVGIHQQGPELEVIIQDNGKGFDLALRDQERNGISNMMKRATEAGGICRIMSQPDAGCRVILIVPVAHPAKSPADWLAQLWRRAWPAKASSASGGPADGISKTPV